MIILYVPASILTSICPILSSNLTTTTIKSTPTCTISSINTTTQYYIITLTNINSTSSNILSSSSTLSLNITLLNITNYYSTITLPSIYIYVYYTNSIIDLMANSTTSTVIKLTNGFTDIYNVSINKIYTLD